MPRGIKKHNGGRKQAGPENVLKVIELLGADKAIELLGTGNSTIFGVKNGKLKTIPRQLDMAAQGVLYRDAAPRAILVEGTASEFETMFDLTKAIGGECRWKKKSRKTWTGIMAIPAAQLPMFVNLAERTVKVVQVIV